MVLLKETYDTLILFGNVLPYVIVLGIIQNKHLIFLNKIASNKISREIKLDYSLKMKKLKRRTPLFLLVGVFTHLIIYTLVSKQNFRTDYLLVILIQYLLFLLLMWGNFLLKGSSILKDTGESGALPG